MMDGDAGVQPPDAGAGQGAGVGSAARVASFVARGGRAVIILCPARKVRTAVLDGVLEGLPGHLTRAGNPLASPLTLHRLLFQIGAGAVDGDDGVLVRRLQERAGPADLVVLAVDDAQTLAPDALAALAQVPAPGIIGGHPGRLLILSGHPDLLLHLLDPGLDALNNPDAALMVDVDLDVDDVADFPAADGPPAERPPLAEAGPPASPLRPPAPPPSASLAAPAGASAAVPAAVSATAPVTASASPAARVSPSAPLSTSLPEPAAAPAQPATRSRRLRWRLGGVAAVGAAALLAALAWRIAPQAARGPIPSQPASTQPAAPSVPPAAAPAIAPLLAAPPGLVPGPDGQTAPPAPRRALPSEADLRREFDLFLDRAGEDTANLSPSDRAALFQEYLAWRSRNLDRTAP